MLGGFTMCELSMMEKSEEDVGARNWHDTGKLGSERDDEWSQNCKLAFRTR